MFKKIEMNFLEDNLRLGTNALFLVVERSNPATVNFFFPGVDVPCNDFLFLFYFSWILHYFPHTLMASLLFENNTL